MKLRPQLLFAGALTLVVPLVAYRAIQQMDSALRDSRSVDLVQKHANAITLLSRSNLLPDLNLPTHPPPEPQVIYAEELKHEISLDGYADDWVNLSIPAVEYPLGNVKSAVGTNRSVVQESRSDVTFSSGDSRRTHAGSTMTPASDSRSSAVPKVQKRGMKVRAAVSRTHLYLFFQVSDNKVVYHDPNLDVLSNGDYVEVFQRAPLSDFADSDPRQPPTSRIVFRAIAPGGLTGKYYGKKFEGLQPILTANTHLGWWVATNDGFQLELKIPKPAPNSSFGFALVDRDRLVPDNADSAYLHWSGTTQPQTSERLAYLVYPSLPVQELLEEVVPAGSRIRLFDRDGRLRADVNSLYEKSQNTSLIDPHNSNIVNALLFRFFEWLIRKQKQASDQSFTPDNRFQLAERIVSDAGNEQLLEKVRSYTTLQRDHVIGKLGPLNSFYGGLSPGDVPAGDDNPDLPAGWLLFESNEDNTNAFTSSAMVRLFSLVTLVSLLVASGLLLFASWLSFRIRRLSKQTRSAVNRDGRITGSFGLSSATGRSGVALGSQDEIGDLSRDFASLLDRSAGYTQYLESLASRLSHELRTPLSVVQTSLENLDVENMTTDNRQLIERAQGGSVQLGRLIKSMSEAARLEHAVQQADYSQLDATQWLYNVHAVYSDIYPNHRLRLVHPSSPCEIRAMPELLQQALDKLVSNAVDFTPPQHVIEFCLQPGSGEITLSVSNQGSTLPAAVAGRLFEPMMSQRSNLAAAADANCDGGAAPHLGLGLYVVKLIAEAHGGNAFAENVQLDSEAGVRVGFTVSRG